MNEVFWKKLPEIDFNMRMPFSLSATAEILLLSAVLLSSVFCGSTQKTAGSDATAKTDPAETVQDSEKQTEEDLLENDPYFTEEHRVGEFFRILITESGYYVKYTGKEGVIERREDRQGDEEQLKTFNKFGKDYKFKDWSFDAILSVRLNPHRGELEHIEYLPGHNPKTWQSGKLFQEDLSRFKFEFPNGRIPVENFLVTYQWRITKKEGLTEEEAKKMAIEFLNSQLKKK